MNRLYSTDMMTVIAFIVAAILAVSGFVFYSNSVSEPRTDHQVAQNETPSDESQMPTLTSLDRSGQGLTEMPKDVLAMRRLQLLDLSSNAFTGALPAEIRHLSNLEVLDISNNRMTGLPAELGQLAKLRILNASNNRLTGIPHELGNLQKLEVLDLSGNDVSEQDLNIIRAKLPASTEIKL